MLSIIIPALNEEKYLPLLLESIKKQSFSDYEIIVADAGSKDNTLLIARKYGCTIVVGGLPGKARNEGALAARSNLFAFIDADVVLPDNFFEKSIAEFNERKLDIASFCIKTHPENKFINFIVEFFYNKPMMLLEKILPHAAMVIFVKSDLFKKLDGYDENITIAEDHDLARRANKVAIFGIIRSVEVFSSDRRARKDGWLKTGIKFLLCELHMIFIGPVKSDIFKYKFDHYNKEKPK